MHVAYALLWIPISHSPIAAVPAVDHRKTRMALLYYLHCHRSHSIPLLLGYMSSWCSSGSSWSNSCCTRASSRSSGLTNRLEFFLSLFWIWSFVCNHMTFSCQVCHRHCRSASSMWRILSKGLTYLLNTVRHNEGDYNDIESWKREKALGYRWLIWCMCYRVHIQESQYRELRGGSNSLTDLRPGEGGIPMNHADLKGGMSSPVPCKNESGVLM